MWISLSEKWERIALDGAVARQGYADQANLRDYGNIQEPEKALQKHLMGCRSECAVAKFLHLPWQPSAGILTNIDVGGKIEVRSRIQPGPGDLAWRPRDKDEPPYVLVHLFPDTRIRLVGWLFGHEMRQADGDWRSSKGTKFIKPPYHSISSLEVRFGPLRDKFAQLKSATPAQIRSELRSGISDPIRRRILWHALDSIIGIEQHE